MCYCSAIKLIRLAIFILPMIHFQVLGFECAACNKAFQLIQHTADELDILIALEKVSDPQLFIQHQVLSVPGIVMNNQLMLQGSCPDKQTIVAWINHANET